MTNENNQHVENENEKKPIKNILLVEDDAIIYDLLTQMITLGTPYQVFSALDALEALDLVKYIKPQLMILDYWLPFMRGIELYDRLHNTEGVEKVPAIMLSVNAPVREINQRHMTYIKKPFDMPKLLDVIHRLIV